MMPAAPVDVQDIFGAKSAVYPVTEPFLKPFRSNLLRLVYVHNFVTNGPKQTVIEPHTPNDLHFCKHL
jgi:hypothetical protein